VAGFALKPVSTRISYLWLACHTQKEIAKAENVDQSIVSNQAKGLCEPCDRPLAELPPTCGRCLRGRPLTTQAFPAVAVL
jgi:hypothetical protein